MNASSHRCLAGAALAFALAVCRAGGAEQGDSVREVSFLEVRSGASADTARELRARIRAPAAASRPGRIRVLEELGRPERFVLLEHGAGSGGPASLSEPIDSLLASVRSALVAPVDRRENRDFQALPADDRSLPARLDAVYVVTHVDIAGPVRPDLERAFADLAQGARANAGNLWFDVWQQTNRPNHFNLIAIWRTRAAFDAFEASGPAQRFRASIASFLGSPFDSRLYRAIE